MSKLDDQGTMSDLRNKVIRLAHANPELRPHLIPLVGKLSVKDPSLGRIHSAGPPLPQWSHSNMRSVTASMTPDTWTEKGKNTLRRIPTSTKSRITAWVFEEEDRVPFRAVVYRGKSKKPIFNRYFRSEKERDDAVNALIGQYEACSKLNLKWTKQMGRDYYGEPMTKAFRAESGHAQANLRLVLEYKTDRGGIRSIFTRPSRVGWQAQLNGTDLGRFDKIQDAKHAVMKTICGMNLVNEYHNHIDILKWWQQNGRG